jgi:hypothetical protein
MLHFSKRSNKTRDDKDKEQRLIPFYFSDAVGFAVAIPPWIR